jgi:hypothetical protein
VRLSVGLTGKVARRLLHRACKLEVAAFHYECMERSAAVCERSCGRCSRPRQLGGRRFAPAHSGYGDHRVCARTAWRHRCSGASCRAFARRWTLKPQPSFPEDGCGSNPALKQPRHPHKRRMRRLHAARRVEAGKRDIQRDDRCVLLRWARETEHGACNERRAKEPALPAATAPHLLISEARFSRA